jgi:serine/threonine protein kinase
MELVDGPTLADHIARGPVPIAESLNVAKQIANALESAHEKGIVHRDLKPANIKIRPDGSVKVLDFGLTKANEAAGTDRRRTGRQTSRYPGVWPRALRNGFGPAAIRGPDRFRHDGRSHQRGSRLDEGAPRPVPIASLVL